MPDILTAYAASQPDKPAVIEDRPDGTMTWWSYQQLEAESNRLANAFATLGAGPGTKIVWCGPNSPQVIAVMNATRKIGAVAVPLNYRLTAPEAQYIIGHCEAAIGVVDAEYAHLFDYPDGGRPGSLRHVLAYGGAHPAATHGEDFLTAADPSAPVITAEAEAAGGASMIYT